MAERDIQAILDASIAAHGGAEFWRGELIGDDEVRILDPAGRVMASRTRPRAAFHGLRRQFRWDELDFLYFDAQRLLTRLDYTAEVVGGWARAAHICEDYQDFGGLKAPTRRRVWPMFFGDKPMSFPNLVALDIDDIRPVRMDS